jgi:transcriptional regulator with XRE-family HTH domain
MDLHLQRHRGHTGARLEQIKKAASLTLEGATIPEIAKELSVSQSTVRRLLAASEGLPTSYLSETARLARLLDLERCDHLLQEFFPLATGRERSPREQSSPGEEISFDDGLAAARNRLGCHQSANEVASIRGRRLSSGCVNFFGSTI